MNVKLGMRIPPKIGAEGMTRQRSGRPSVGLEVSGYPESDSGM